MTTLTLHETVLTVPDQGETLPFTDERLMEMIQARLRDGLWLLHTRYMPLMRRIGADVLHNEADVEDLLQDVFTEIWNRAARYEPAKGRPLGWIITLTRRRAIDRLRRREAYCRAGERFAEEMRGSNDCWTHVHEDVARHEVSERLLSALSDLPEAQRKTIHLAYYRQMSQREIATQTGTPLGTVKTRLELGLQKMAAFLSGYEDLLATDKWTITTPNGIEKTGRRSRHGAGNLTMSAPDRRAVFAPGSRSRCAGTVKPCHASPPVALSLMGVTLQ